jgi:hypothetical protein
LAPFFVININERTPLNGIANRHDQFPFAYVVALWRRRCGGREVWPRRSAS